MRQQPSGHHPIAAVVARPAQHGHTLRLRELPARKRRHGRSCGPHQINRRYPEPL